jgi:hypothetical protein
MNKSLTLLACLVLTGSMALHSQEKAKAIYRSDAYSIYQNKVVQGSFTSTAISASDLISDYTSPEEGRYSPEIVFKFSINLRDNEMASGHDHKVTLRPVNGHCTTNVQFGKQFLQTTEIEEHVNLEENTCWTLRLDLRAMMNDFNKLGFYTLFNGDKLYRDDFKGVYVAGNQSPLSWDFSNLDSQPGLQLTDEDNDGIFETTLIMNSRDNSKTTASSWNLSKDISAFPTYHSDYLISDALYNLAIEEMVKAVEPDSTFRTGKEWAGVWTRDISYSIILSMAYLQPKVAMNSLMRKVKNGRIIQDTGTGGAYPVSSDRMIWAVAAWEVYKATGSKEWLELIYPVIKNSIEDDMHNIYNAETGMVKGESSFLDWREQTYPRWMEPADIFTSENLGTNAVHFQANTVLAMMAELHHDKDAVERYKLNAENIKSGINKYLWQADKGYYGQYLYGRNFLSLSPGAEALGEALCILFGISDQNQSTSMVSKVPVSDFGIPCIYPQIPGIPPYHNNGIWPFVQSFWALASAKAGNEKAVIESIAAIYRPAALFLTNKENFVATTGDYAGTQINSDNMLWSLSGSIALVHKVLFGLQFGPESLSFNPFIPHEFEGKHYLKGLNYRNMVLDIEIEGYGNKIKSFAIDGIENVNYSIPASLKGRHKLLIVLNGFPSNEDTINKSSVVFSPETPLVKYENGILSWDSIENVKEYEVLLNGKIIAKTKENLFKVELTGYAEYQIMAIGNNNNSSFASEPLEVFDNDKSIVLNMEDFTGPGSVKYGNFTGSGYVTFNTDLNTEVNIPIEITEKGVYSINFRYANGNGPVNTENKCAIRTLQLNGNKCGTFVFPQRGSEEWSNWGLSNAVTVSMDKGKNILQLIYQPENENMHGEINEVAIDSIILTRTGPD